ncbi:hypothetical protein ACIBK8_33280 [Streptomyces sp. NPDC050161]
MHRNHNHADDERETRHLGAVRLERHRLGSAGVKNTYDAVAAVVASLA